MKYSKTRRKKPTSSSHSQRTSYGEPSSRRRLGSPDNESYTKQRHPGVGRDLPTCSPQANTAFRLLTDKEYAASLRDDRDCGLCRDDEYHTKQRHPSAGWDLPTHFPQANAVSRLLTDKEYAASLRDDGDCGLRRKDGGCCKP